MEKQLQIAFKDIQSSEFIEGMIRERVDRLERIYPHIIGCRVVVEVPHRAAESGKPPLGITVEVEVPGHPMVVGKDEQERREVKNDHYAVVGRAFDAVQRQLQTIGDVKTHTIKHHDGLGEAGLVVGLFPDQNYGFIEVRGFSDLYFSRDVVSDGNFDELATGMMVEVTRASSEGPMGPQASSVRILNARRGPG